MDKFESRCRILLNGIAEEKECLALKYISFPPLSNDIIIDTPYSSTHALLLLLEHGSWDCNEKIRINLKLLLEKIYCFHNLELFDCLFDGIIKIARKHVCMNILFEFIITVMDNLEKQNEHKREYSRILFWLYSIILKNWEICSPIPYSIIEQFIHNPPSILIYNQIEVSYRIDNFIFY